MGAARAARRPPRLRDSIVETTIAGANSLPQSISARDFSTGCRALSTPLRRPEQRFPGEGGIGLKAEQSQKARVTPTERTV